MTLEVRLVSVRNKDLYKNNVLYNQFYDLYEIKYFVVV